VNNTTEKLAFTFWDGPQLSLLNILSLLSFARLNPDTVLTIYTLGGGLDINAGWKTGEHALAVDQFYALEDLACEPNIRIQKVDSVGLEKINSVVQVADYIRIKMLYEHGGIWIDTDVLFFKKLPDYLWEIVATDGFVISYENTITTGFMGFPRGSSIVHQALLRAQLRMRGNSFHANYQAFGPNLWEEIFLAHPDEISRVQFLSDKLVYPILWKKLDQFFFQQDDSINFEETIGVHWYGGSKYARSFTNNNLAQSLSQNPPLTNFQKIIHRLAIEINLLNDLPLPIQNHP
jgi:hypothetical protein